MLTLHLRREPTTDSTILRYGAPRLIRRARDVVAYSDAALTQPKARWTAMGRLPRRNCRTVMLNCYRWAAVWHPDVTQEGVA